MDKKWVSNIDGSTQTWGKLARVFRLSQQKKKEYVEQDAHLAS